MEKSLDEHQQQDANESHRRNGASDDSYDAGWFRTFWRKRDKLQTFFTYPNARMNVCMSAEFSSGGNLGLPVGPFLVRRSTTCPQQNEFGSNIHVHLRIVTALVIL